MILTVTPNPSLDRTYEIPALDRGAVLRATADRIDPGGKGVNVSRAVAAAGHRTLAVLPLGGPAGAALAGLLGAEGIEVAGVPVAGQTRSNISVAEPDGTLTKINATGPELTADESEALLADGRRALGGRRLDRLLRQPAARPGARVVRGTGRPRAPGRRPDRAGHLGPVADRGAARAPGRRQAERRGAGAGRRPPARDRRRRGQGGRGAAGIGARARYWPPWARTGNCWSTRTARYFGSAPVAAVRSNVGAGDASLAGFLAAGGTGVRALAAAVAHGAAAVQLPGSQMPTPADLDPAAVTTTDAVPLDRPLTEPAP